MEGAVRGEELRLEMVDAGEGDASWIAVFSDDDPVVPYEENAEIFKENLGVKIILEKGMGHFSQGEGVTKLPLLLELIK